MNILITGSSGFVGRNLVESFAQSDHTIFAPSSAELNLTDGDCVKHFFAAHPIDVIIHSATTSLNGKVYPPDVCERNLRMFFNLREQMTPAMKMINLGSGSEYGRKHWHKKMSEDFLGRHAPEDGHSYSKQLISSHIRDAHDKRLRGLLIFGIFGKYEDYRYKFISNAIVKNLFGIPITINQNVVYDYLYIADLLRIVEHFLYNDTESGLFNSTPTQSIDLVTIAHTINEISGKPVDVQVLHPGIGVEYSGDNTKLLSEVGGFQFTAYKTAIAELYAYYKAIKHTLDVDAIKQDLYLRYAQELHATYFKKNSA